MTKIPLTARQQKILDFIRDYQSRNGYAPTVRDIGAGNGITSPNGVICHLDALVKKGWLKRGDMKARAMSIVDDGEDDLLDLLKEAMEDRQCAVKCDGPNQGCPCWYCRAGEAVAKRNGVKT